MSVNDRAPVAVRFLRQEAENFALFNYVTELNGEIEARQEEVNSVQQNIDATHDEQQETIAATEHELETLMVGGGLHRRYNETRMSNLAQG